MRPERFRPQHFVSSYSPDRQPEADKDHPPSFTQIRCIAPLGGQHSQLVLRAGAVPGWGERKIEVLFSTKPRPRNQERACPPPAPPPVLANLRPLLWLACRTTKPFGIDCRQTPPHRCLVYRPGACSLNVP